MTGNTIPVRKISYFGSGQRKGVGRNKMKGNERGKSVMIVRDDYHFNWQVVNLLFPSQSAPTLTTLSNLMDNRKNRAKNCRVWGGGNSRERGTATLWHCAEDCSKVVPSISRNESYSCRELKMPLFHKQVKAAEHVLVLSEWMIDTCFLEISCQFEKSQIRVDNALNSATNTGN